MKFSRPDRLVLLVLALGAARPAPAQTNITDKQREDLGRHFMSSPGATPAEKNILLRAQESREALPADFEALKKAFIESSWAYRALADDKAPELGTLLLWNEIALYANALDHTTPNTEPNNANPPIAPYYGEQLGPPRSIRVMAMVHVAMDEAVGVIRPKYQSYAGIREGIVNRLTVPDRLLIDALAGDDEHARVAKNRAIVEAAYRTLVQLYPKKKPLLDKAYELNLNKFPDPTVPSVALGATVGARAAKAIQDLRYFDGSELPELSSANFLSENPFRWHQDPISKDTLTLAQGGNWFRVKPFLIRSADSFREKYLPGPPSPGDPKFIAAFKWTKYLGGDPNANTADGDRRPTPTYRTGADDPKKPTPPPPDDTNQDQTFVGIFWAYDGSSNLCAPPRLYNMLATSVALREKPVNNVEDFAHYLAFLNATMADAALAAWDGKFHFIYPRPVTLIREVKADDTPEGAADPLWTPLGAQATNAARPKGNFSPPFPAYPSGHATFGGALFKGMTLFFQSIDPTFPDQGIPFDFVSDEYNGKNYAPGPGKPQETPRDRVVCHFKSFKQAERLNAESRIYLGVHWEFDAVDGVNLGNAIAEDAFRSFVKKLPK